MFRLVTGSFRYSLSPKYTTFPLYSSNCSFKLAVVSNIFIKYWDENHQLNHNHNCDSNKFFNIYNLLNLSFSYFISNLIDYVIDEDTSERDWFMFPIISENGKEDNGIGYCCVQ